MSALTPRELEILRLVANGLTSAQAALEAACKVRTVKYHLWRVREKLGATTTVHAIALAVSQNMVAVEPPPQARRAGERLRQLAEL